MRRFLRGFVVFTLVLVLGVLASGCTLFEQNLDHDYNRIVATVEYGGDTVIKITKKELYETYNSYGYQYVQYGDTVEEAYKKTLDALIDREVTIKIAVEKFDPERKYTAGVLGLLTEYEADTARKNAFTSLDSALNQFIDEINGIEQETSTEEETEDTGAVVYEPYKKTITVSPDYKEFTPDLETYRDVLDIGFVSQKWSPELPPNAGARTFTKALTRVINNLTSREKGFEDLISRENHTDKKHKDEIWRWFINEESGLLNESLDHDEMDVLNREILRMVKSNEKTILVNRLSTMFTLGLDGMFPVSVDGKEEMKTGFDIYMNRGNDFASFENAVKAGGTTAIAVNNAKEAYKNLIKQAIIDYNLNPPEDMEADLLATGEGKGLSGVYYVPGGIAEKLFNVSHILVSFTDAQKARLTEIETLAAADSSFNKEQELLKLYAQTKTADGKSVYAVYDDVKSGVDNALSLQEKYEIFRDKIYEYNTDPGMQNPEFEYVMSTTESKNGMIAEFTAASLELKKAGEKGAVSGIVWGEYGAHIIMYTRDLTDFIYSASAELLSTAYERTLFATQTSYGNKTIFDTLLGTTSYDSYEKVLITQYKSNKTIKIYTDIYKNLYKTK
jgi:hypothetical protein